MIDGLTGDQRVFLGWAQAWAGKATPEAIRNADDQRSAQLSQISRQRRRAEHRRLVRGVRRKARRRALCRRRTSACASGSARAMAEPHPRLPRPHLFRRRPRSIARGAACAHAAHAAFWSAGRPLSSRPGRPTSARQRADNRTAPGSSASSRSGWRSIATALDHLRSREHRR